MAVGSSMLNGGIPVEAAMSILKHPDAQPLLQDAVLSPDDVRSCAASLTAFAQRYLPLFQRSEQRDHALTILSGKLSGLQRKTTEPIATQAGLTRRNLQLFVGAGAWDDQAVRTALRAHVAEELADPDGVFILDGSAHPKKGIDSCGVARQWCGRLGKVDNCQQGYFLAYAGRRGGALLDARLYLPADWAADGIRRDKTHVPADVIFQEGWRIALGLLDEARRTLPGRWVVGDDEFGRASELRGELRLRGLRYLLDVPCNTLVRDPSERRPPRREGGRTLMPVFERVEHWVARQPAGRWRKVKVRDGEKGPVVLKVLLASVQAKDEDGRVGPRERLVVLRSCESKPQTWYTLSNAQEARRGELAGVHGKRHGIEERLEEGKGEVGLSHYEVRSWVGWHHHMTLSLLALWFLQLERLRLGKKNSGGDGAPGAGGLHGVAARTGTQRGADRRSGQSRAAA
jgi:SRSO17 transposase